MPEPGKKLPDTNTILRYLLKDDPAQYNTTSSFFEKVRLGDEKAIILESVLVECVYVLGKFYKVPRDVLSNTLQELLRYKGITNRDKRN